MQEVKAKWYIYCCIYCIETIMGHEGYTEYLRTYIGNREAMAGRCMYNLYAYMI